MMNHSSLFLLLDAPPAQGGLMQIAILVVPLVAIFYFMILRPQQKQAKEQQDLLNSLKKGEKVMTTAGIIGKIWAVKDQTLLLEVSRDVRIELDKSAIRRKMDSEKGD